MKVIRHHDKFMQQVLLLSPVMEKNFQKQIGHPVGLKQAVLLECRGGDEVSAESRIASVWCSHCDLSG